MNLLFLLGEIFLLQNTRRKHMQTICIASHLTELYSFLQGMGRYPLGIKDGFAVKVTLPGLTML